MYCLSDGVGLNVEIDSSSGELSTALMSGILSTGVTSVYSDCLMGYDSSGVPGADFQQWSMIDHSQSSVGDTARLCAADVSGSGPSEGACPAEHAALLSAAECQQDCGSMFKSLRSRRITYSDSVRVHPYGRRCSNIASSQPELCNSAAAYDFSPALSRVEVG